MGKGLPPRTPSEKLALCHGLVASPLPTTETLKIRNQTNLIFLCPGSPLHLSCPGVWVMQVPPLLSHPFPPRPVQLSPLIPTQGAPGHTCWPHQQALGPGQAASPPSPEWCPSAPLCGRSGKGVRAFTSRQEQAQGKSLTYKPEVPAPWPPCRAGLWP